MCGIAGKLWLDPGRPADRDVVAAMTGLLIHRGPDDEGFAAEGPLALGHRRLSIVDLSPRGRQPMRFGGGSQGGRSAAASEAAAGGASGGATAGSEVLLVANGEIYNHRELRVELAARGHAFASDCDVEVIGAAYREWWPSEGPRFVRRLHGMFAFALWDAGHRRLVLARDRTGQKPLVYAEDGASLTFASELNALAAEPSLDRTPDWSALSDYLAFRVVPHPKTAWSGARKLPAGSVLVHEAGASRIERYWRLSPGSDHARPPRFEDAVEEVKRRLSTAVSRRLMSDVPLGCLLSGGMDSAAVAALMARHHDGPVKTFTLGFDDPAYDETADARVVARLLGTDHHDAIVRPDAGVLLDEVLDRYGEPFADSSALPTFLVSRLARESVKVVLTGDGGDESFAGYDRHRALLLAERLSTWWGRPVAAVLDALSPHTGGGQRSRAVRLRRFLDALPASPRRRNHLWRLGMAEPVRAELLTDQGHEVFGGVSFYGADVDLPFPLNEALVLDVERYLPDDLLVKVDIASMAHGLEARAPFLDHELMEYVASLPGAYKATPRTGKRVLAEALRGLLPPDVLDRPKRGFGVPLDAWFRGPLAETLREVLLSPRSRARGLFRSERIASLIDQHVAGRVAEHETLYTLLVLERWFQREEGV